MRAAPMFFASIRIIRWDRVGIMRLTPITFHIPLMAAWLSRSLLKNPHRAKVNERASNGVRRLGRAVPQVG